MRRREARPLRAPDSYPPGAWCNPSVTTSFACPTCGNVHEHQSDRYRNHLCQECEGRATCTHHRPVEGYNTSFSGGFAARHADEEHDECDQVTADGRVWVDGRQLEMREARFGGVVIVQLRQLTPVADTVVWSLAERVEWTSDGVPQPWAGFVAALAGRRRWLRPAPVQWEWMVRDTAQRVVHRHGIAGTADEARAAVVAVLDELCRDDPSYV
jgi:hypothetical protein